MRITPKLLHVASLLMATGYCMACGGKIANDGTGCGTGPSVDVTAAQACTLIEAAPSTWSQSSSGACDEICGSPLPYSCALPAQFVESVQALNADAGRPPDGAGLPLQCPSDAGTVTISCMVICVGGRLTQGY
jgi:hypothetical protein